MVTKAQWIELVSDKRYFSSFMKSLSLWKENNQKHSFNVVSNINDLVDLDTVDQDARHKIATGIHQ